jgi:hypothetical protein
VPINEGVTGQTFARQKTNYYNDFVKKDCKLWYPESDNVNNLKQINNFIFFPLVGNQGQSNGII